MNIDVDFYREQGYVLLRNYLDKNIVAQIYTETRQIFAEQIKRVLNKTVDIEDRKAFEQALYEFFQKDLKSFINCGKQVNHLLSLHRFGTDEAFIKVANALGLEFPVISNRPTLLFNSPHLATRKDYWKLEAHQDWRPSQGSLDSITAWFPLIDCDTALGALQVMPKSHYMGLLRTVEYGYYGEINEVEMKDEDFVQLEFEAGDVLFFNALLVHRSGLNSTDDVRWSVQYRYNNINEPTFIERGFPSPFNYKPDGDVLVPGFPSKDDMFAALHRS
jgi:phytanoyl-CoA hydroxylase